MCIIAKCDIIKVRRAVGIVDKVVVVDDVTGRGHAPRIEVNVRDRRESKKIKGRGMILYPHCIYFSSDSIS